MAYPAAVQEAYQAELQSIRDKGIYKVERTSTPRRRPASRWSSRPVRRSSASSTSASNNYLGLSQPPRGGRRRAPRPRRARLRHVERPLHLRHAGHPPRAGEQAHRVPRHRGHDPLPELHGRQRRGVRGGPERPGRHDRRPPGAREHRGRHAPVQGDAGHLQARRHEAPGAEAPGAPGQARPADHHRRRVQHGRRPRAARRDRRAGREVQRDGVRGRQPRQRLHGEDRARHARALRRRRQDRHHHHDARQGARRGERRLRVGPQGDRRAVPPEGAAVPVQQRRAAADRLRGDQGARDPQREHRAARPPRGEPAVLAQGG